MNKGRIFTVMLIVSLGLNFLFIGTIIGRNIMLGPPQFPHPLGWVAHSIDKAERDKIAPLLRENTLSNIRLLQEMRIARHEFNQLLMEEQVDETAIDKSLQRLRNASSDYQSTVHQQMIVILKDLKPEQRRKVARYLMNHRRSDRMPRHRNDR